MAGLDPAALIAQYGAYFRSGTISKKDLHDKIFDRSGLKDRFMTRKVDSTIIDNIQLTMTSVLQPFYNRHSAKGQLGFVPNVFKLDRVKINVTIDPDELYDTAVNFLVQRGVYREDAPLGLIVGMYLIMQAKEDDDIEVEFKGRRKEVSPTDQGNRVAGPVVDSRDGVRHKIRTYHAAGKSKVVAMGAVPTNSVELVEYIREFYQSIDKKYVDMIDGIEIARELRDSYMDGHDTKYNTNYNRDGAMLKIHNTDVPIYTHASQNGSSLIWAATKRNRVGFIKGASNKNVFNVFHEDGYTVKFQSDWAETYDFVNPAEIWHTDQDLTIPA